MPIWYIMFLIFCGSLTIGCLTLTTAVGIGAIVIPKRFARFALRWDRKVGFPSSRSGIRDRLERFLLRRTRAFGTAMFAASMVVFMGFVSTVTQNVSLLSFLLTNAH